MQTTSLLPVLSSSLTLLLPAFAQNTAQNRVPAPAATPPPAPSAEFVNVAQTTTSSHNHKHLRADDHAPIGVMGDHLHGAGDWMVGLHFMSMRMDGHREGTNRLSTAEVFARTAPNGSHYSMAAKEMTMDHLMGHVMFAPTDWLSLMVMPSYVWTDMDMVMDPDAASHGGHGAAMAGHGGGHSGGGNGKHSHGTEGFGDLPVVALFPLWQQPERGMSLHGGLGVSIPTGEIDAKQDGVFLPYDMQIGSGTWDLLPSLTWNHHFQRWSYGAQISANLPLYPEYNGVGTRRGETYQATSWMTLNLADWVSVSTRLIGTSQGDINGHYNGAHAHTAPNHFQPNAGGEFLDLGLGANFVIPRGPLQGHRFGIEYLIPVYQDLNGVGMNREGTLSLGWSKAF